MSTSVRRGDGAGKEKKGISPSTSSNTTKKTTRPLTSVSSSHGEKKTVSSSTTRQSLNHIKPTRTISNGPSRPSKKPITEPSNPKSAPPRRRSFDHPPPPSHVQKAIRDAKNSRSATTLKNTTKSASFSSRPSLSERPVKKVVRSLSISPSLKKNTLSNTTTTPLRGPSKGTSLIKKGVKSSMSDSNLNLHGNSLDIDDHLSIDDDLVNIENDEVKSLPEISEMPISGSDLGDPATIDDEVKQPIEEEDHENSNFKDGQELEEDASVVDNHVAEEPTTQDNTVVDDVQVEEKQSEDQNKIEEPTNKEQIEGGEQNQTEKLVDDQGVVDQEVNKDEPNETFSEEKKEDVVSPKKEEKMDKVVETKTETIANINHENIYANTIRKSPAISRSQSMGEREKEQAYNDVIEQTASKLRSKTSKVLALAGAFETVISLQDPSKK